jgi:hypothetical protein
VLQVDGMNDWDTLFPSTGISSESYSIQYSLLASPIPTPSPMHTQQLNRYS